MPSLKLSSGTRGKAAAELLRRRQARRHLLDFTKATCSYYEANWHHQLLCAYLDRFVLGEIYRLIINQPPQTGKSELASRRLPAFLLGLDPDAQVLACSYGADLAQDMSRDVQAVMDDTPYRALFPGSQLSRGTGVARRCAGAFEVIGRRGYYKCAGVGGPLTGKSMDWGLIDDPIKNREEADSPVMQEHLWKWYTSVFLSRLHKGTKILIVMTRWNEQDLTGKLLARAEADPKADQWTVLTLPSLAEDDNRHPEDQANRKLGEPLWPDKHPMEELEKIRAASPTDWHSMHQQHPRPEGGTEWPDSYFGPGIWFDEWPRDLTLKAIGLDPSKGKDAKWGDYSAYVLLGRDSKGTLFCEADLARRSTEQIVADGIEHQRRFNADIFAVEANAFQELLAVQIAKESAAAGMMVPVVPMVNTVNKQVRIRRLGPYLRAGNLRFKGGHPGTRLLVSQLRDFPLAAHDDGPDALELCLRSMIELYNGRQQKKPQRLRA